MNYRLIYVLLIATFTAGCLAAQKSDLYSFNQTGFIENLDATGILGEAAPYRTEINGLKVYFTTRGLRYSVHGQHRRRVKDKYAPNLDDGPTHEIIEYTEDFSVFFVDPSDSLTIEALGQRSNYVVQNLRVKQKCYDRVMYRNVWPNIDIEFIMPDKGGIKYNIYLEPGADVNDIKLDYAAANALDLVDGNLHVYSGLGKWVEYAPVSYNESTEEIESGYELNDGILSFRLPTNEITAPTVIDPWIALIPAITSYDSLPDPADSLWVGPIGFDLIGTGLDNAYNRVQIDYDAVGNIYLSQIPCLFYESPDGFDDFYAVARYIHKFSPQGELIFTVDHGTEYAVCTDITVNKTSQNFYSSSLFSNLMYMTADGTTTDVFPIDDLPESLGELISMQFDHCQDKLILGLGADNLEFGSFIATTGPSFTGALDYSFAYDLSLSATNALPFNDNVDVLIDPFSGDYYMLFLLRTQTGFQEDRALVKTDPVNVNPIWQTNGSFLYLVELAMHSRGIIQGNLGRMHYESLACGESYVYGMNGSNLLQWDKTNGSIVNDLEIYPFFQNAGRAEGIDVDLCGNVYVGANNEIQVFDSLLNPLITIPLSGMPQDIQVFGNKLYVAQDFNLESIDIPESLSPWQFTQEPDSCNLCAGGASIQFCGALDSLSNITVEWQANGETGFSTSGLCAGWNQIEIFETKACYTNIYVDSVFVESVETSDCAFQAQLNDLSICSGECTTLAATISGGIAPYNFEWDHDGTLETSSIEICPAITTTYTLTASDTTGETITVSATVEVLPSPSLNLGNDTTLCQGDVLVLTAEADGASIVWLDGSTEISYAISSPGTYWADATIGACTARDTINVLYSTLTLDLGNDTTLCSFDGFQLDAGADPTSYTWQDGTNTQFYAVEEPGFYGVNVSDGFCELSDNIFVDISQPEANFSVEDSIACDVQPTQFLDGSTSGGGSVNSWSWNFGDGSFSTVQNPLHTYQQPGTYEVRLTVVDEFGCESIYSKTVEISTLPGPEAFFSVDPATPNVFENVQFTDESQSAISWKWSFGDGNGSFTQNPLHSYEVPGSYAIELTVSNENCTETIRRIILVGDDLIVFVPNSFTPNEDGINDLFKAVVSGGDPTEFKMWVFNRWGEELFYTEDYTEGWRGSYKASFSNSSEEYYVPNGVYVWKIRVKENLSTERLELSGHVTLIR